MSEPEWNSVTVEKEEQPRVSMQDLREMAADLDPDDFDEAVQVFLDELQNAESIEELQQVATLLLQDEIDFSPEFADMGIEPDLDLIALLISCGADVDAPNAYGQTPLHLAAQYAYVPVVEMLLAAGAKRTLHNHAGKTAAELAPTPELAAMLTPQVDEDAQLPPEVLDGDYEPEEEHGCHDHHDHHDACHCGHKH